MSPFEFFFSLFGLILGLAIATVIGGLSDLYRQREKVKTGWLTPMLALFVLCDLSTLWVNAWTGLSDIRVAYGPFFSALIIAGIYFFAASMVFPKTASDWPSLDDYYISHRRFVLAGVMAANLGLGVIHGVTSRNWAAFVHDTFIKTDATLTWWIVLALMFIISRKSVQLIGLSILLLGSAFALVKDWGGA